MSKAWHYDAEQQLVIETDTETGAQMAVADVMLPEYGKLIASAIQVARAIEDMRRLADQDRSVGPGLLAPGLWIGAGILEELTKP